MSLAIQPGQLVMVNIQGTRLDEQQAKFLRDHAIRAVCLFRWNLGSEAEVRQLTADLREAMGPCALIGLDQEGGSVVRATFLPQPPAAMALGASVTVTLPSSAPHGYPLPASALTRIGDKPAVFVITPQSRAQLRAVVPASYTATSVMIASGLEPGDRVITAGVSTLRSGEPVMVGEVQP